MQGNIQKEVSRLFVLMCWAYQQALISSANIAGGHTVFYKGTCVKRKRVSESVPSASKPV